MIESQIPKTNTREESQGTGLIAFHGWLTTFEAEVSAQVKRVSISSQEATAKLMKGMPLLSWRDIEPDWSMLLRCLNDVLLALNRHFPTLAKRVESLQTKIYDLTLAQEVVKACYLGQSLPGAISRKEESRILRLAGQAAFRPFLCTQRKVLMPLVDQELWRKGSCPVCGGLPDFAFLDKEQEARWLVCCRCDAQWVFRRLQCPYCDNQDQDTVCFLTDEEGYYRVYLCEECHSYLKAVDLGKKEPVIDVSGHRTETLDLDRQAQDKGYKCPESFASVGFRHTE